MDGKSTSNQIRNRRQIESETDVKSNSNWTFARMHRHHCFAIFVAAAGTAAQANIL